jgi:hypothetical protein
VVEVVEEVVGVVHKMVAVANTFGVVELEEGYKMYSLKKNSNSNK